MLNSMLATFLSTLVNLAQPYAIQQGHPLSLEQTRCLTEATYYESRGEGPTGIAAVAFIILNRSVKKDRSICTIVHEAKQFSYYQPGRHYSVHEANAWINCVYIAVSAQLGLIENPIDNATQYNTTVMPSWRNFVMSKKINHHYFYTLKADYLTFSKPRNTASFTPPESVLYTLCTVQNTQRAAELQSQECQMKLTTLLDEAAFLQQDRTLSASTSDTDGATQVHYGQRLNQRMTRIRTRSSHDAHELLRSHRSSTRESSNNAVHYARR